MQKGQVSFDLILAVAAAMIAFGGIAAVSDAIIQMQGEAAVRQQLDSIGNSLVAIISGSKGLKDGDNLLIQCTVPPLAVPGETQLQQCDILIERSTGKLTLSYDVIDLKSGTSRTVSVEKEFLDLESWIEIMPVAPEKLKCGSEIKIFR